MQAIKAVITGDFVESRAQTAAELDRAMDIIARQADRLSEQTHNRTRFTRFRGDGWQIYLDFPGLCLSASLQIAAVLRANDIGMATRQSIGLGTVKNLPIGGNLAAAQGDAFEHSGLGLDHMDKSRRMEIHGRGLVTRSEEAVIALADWCSRRWSREQAEAVELAARFDLRTHADLAAELHITRQAFQSRLSSAGFWAWSEALQAFQSKDWGQDA